MSTPMLHMSAAQHTGSMFRSSGAGEKNEKVKGHTNKMMERKEGRKEDTNGCKGKKGKQKKYKEFTRTENFFKEIELNRTPIHSTIPPNYANFDHFLI